MKIDIDNKFVDGLVVESLKQSISFLKKDLKDFKKKSSKKKLETREKLDLADCIENLAALERAFDYYGGNLK